MFVWAHEQNIAYVHDNVYNMWGSDVTLCNEILRHNVRFPTEGTRYNKTQYIPFKFETWFMVHVGYDVQVKKAKRGISQTYSKRDKINVEIRMIL